MSRILGYKKCQVLHTSGLKQGQVKHLVLVTLDLTNAQIYKSSESTNKFRASEAYVVSIQKLRMADSHSGRIGRYSQMEQSIAKDRFVKTCLSIRSKPEAPLRYNVRQRVLPDSFSLEDVACKNGIHFFFTKKEAINF